METLLIVARAALAGIFLLAAVAKVADREGSRRALSGFGVPTRFLGPAAVLLPAVEIAAALLLVPSATAAIGGALAALLLFVFIAGISTALQRGETPDCHCFGQLHSRPVGRETLVRNGLLAAAALLVVLAGGGPAFSDWVTETGGTEIALGATSLLAAVSSYLVASMWLERQRAARGAGGSHGMELLEPGTKAPAFTVVGLDGRRRSSEDLLEGRTVLVFLSASCGPCRGLLPELARWKKMLAGRLQIHAISTGDRDELEGLSEEHEVEILLDPQGAATRGFAIAGTPSGVEVAADGSVMSYPAPGALAIENLIRAALKRLPTEGAIAVVTQSPTSAAPGGVRAGSPGD